MTFVKLFLHRKVATILSCNKRLLHAEPLHNRSLVKVSGDNVAEFLQGLMTNDIYHLAKNISSIYTMFLNVQGRVLFDGIIYKSAENYIIDCDSQVVKPLINHMKLYKVRKKIDFEVLDALKVWVVFDNCIDMKKLTVTDMENLYINPKHRTASYIDNEEGLPNQAILSRDPRLKYLGDRIILPVNNSLKDYAAVTLVKGDFQTLRFRLGVGEGVSDMERGKSLPLEANCDYLHGISFQKGCYIGQELTARTYHTGVVRKRFMPLVFEKDIAVERNSGIFNLSGKNVGKVIGACKGYGIGLLRILEALDTQSLTVGQMTVKTFKPGWWPIEVSKDRRIPNEADK